MNELTKQEQLQIDLSFEFASEIVMPLLANYEDTLKFVAGEDAPIGSPHYDVMALCVYELIDRGWMADEIIERVRAHTEQIVELRKKRVVN